MEVVVMSIDTDPSENFGERLSSSSGIRLFQVKGARPSKLWGVHTHSAQVRGSSAATSWWRLLKPRMTVCERELIL